MPPTCTSGSGSPGKACLVNWISILNCCFLAFLEIQIKLVFSVTMVTPDQSKIFIPGWASKQWYFVTKIVLVYCEKKLF